ncbi:MAG: TlpA family protein disulfide reductase [Phycisphaerales bacterium]|nr:TlpA family protein disulfide reductase [Phycisphaerales bacterium]
MFHERRLGQFMLAATVALAAPMALGAKDDLKVGAQAPGLAGHTWVKQLEDESPSVGDKPLVVEFWATWCGPCKRSIPHLTKLQDKYGLDQLSVVGVTQPDDAQSKSDVKRFVQRQGNRMEYFVALDDDGKIHKDWMAAAKQNGIPTVFIVGQEGRIQYIGSPFDRRFDDILAKVVRGRYDHKTVTAAKRHLDAISRARSIKNWDEYYRISDKLLMNNPKIFADLYMERFDVELLDRGNPEKAYMDAIILTTTRRDDPVLLSWMAEKIALDPDVPDDKRNMDAAITLISAARASGGLKEPNLIASEAKIRLARGETKQAVDLQREAYYQAPKNRKEQFNRTLQDYKAQLKREQG